MNPLFVSAIGAFTPVGVNLPQTMGSLLSRLQWFDDLDLIGASGEPVSGARVRLRSAESVTERYVGMSRFALAECRQSVYATRSSHEPAPLLLATSNERDLPCPPKLLLSLILEGDQEGRPAGAGDAIDRRASRVFAEGRVGALQALAAAQAIVSSGRAPACYVGGVDSLLDPVRLNELLDEGKLLDGPGTDGVIPGEGAVFLKLEARAASRSSSVVLASAMVDDRGGSTPPGSALARAAAEALRAAKLGASSLAALVHDGSSDQTTVEEIAMAITRLPFDGATQLRPWTPAFSVGETGAAAACLSVAMTAFFLQEEVFDGPVLIWLISESSARTAVVMGPGARKEARRG
jgi:3-oxoacyl-[acyl-carrier-protein] synthase-1